MIITDIEYQEEQAQAKVLLAEINAIISKKEKFGSFKPRELDILYKDSVFCFFAIDYIDNIQLDLLPNYEKGILDTLSALHTLTAKYL